MQVDACNRGAACPGHQAQERPCQRHAGGLIMKGYGVERMHANTQHGTESWCEVYIAQKSLRMPGYVQPRGTRVSHDGDAREIQRGRGRPTSPAPSRPLGIALTRTLQPTSLYRER